MTQTIPDSFYCPIGMTLMEDPWMCPEGYSFDKKNIFAALDIKQESPITRTYLTKDMMKPNRSLKDSIDAIRDSVTLELLSREIDAQSQNNSNRLTKNLPDDFQLAIKTTYFDNKVHIKLIPSNSNKRQNKHVVLVVDVSGSMGTDAQSDTETERDGLSVLDLVKQAIITIVMNLTGDDILSIISYSENANVVCEMVRMDTSGKEEVKTKLKELKPYGRTNIWDGLRLGVDSVMKAKSLVGGSGIFLLTDGQPNVNPIRPIEVMLKNKIDSCKGLSCNFNTFGFGHQLDSELLNKLAFDGSFSYINDSSMLGTNFVNALANFLANITNIQVKVELEDRKIQSIPGYPYKNLSWGSLIDIGQIQYGDSRDIILVLEPSENSDSETIPNITVACDTSNQHIQSKINTCVSSEITLASPQSQIGLMNQFYRLITCDSLEKAKNFMLIGQKSEAQREIKDLVSLIECNMDSHSNQFIKGLIQDLKEQVSQSVSQNAWFTKWGCHFLSAIRKAHLYQMCMDFKNPGIQIYGGELFAQIRLDGEDIFCNLPPPEPSNKDDYDNNYRGGGGRRYVASSSQSITQSYYNSSNTCFHGDCLVSMFQHPKKKVSAIVKGDIVTTPYGPSKVVCVVKTIINPKNKIHMVRFNSGLVITPYHPIMVKGIWEFPCNLKRPEAISVDAIYSFVLDSGDVICVNDTHGACLGHSFRDNDIIKHEYFGSQKVIQDLRKLDGWSNGQVNITENMIHRNLTNNRINRIGF